MRDAIRSSVSLLLCASAAPSVASSEQRSLAQLAQALTTDRSASVGFVVGVNAITHTAKPGLFVRLGESISRQALKRRLVGYNVRYAKEEGCLICAVVTGPDGQFDVVSTKMVA